MLLLSMMRCLLQFSDTDLGMHEIVSKFLRYVVTGGVASMADAGGLAFLIDAHLDVLIAGIASFCAAAVVNYLLTCQFVFGRIVSARGFALFLFAALIGLSVNVSITVIGVYVFILPPIVASWWGLASPSY
jgi:putative flippase GtrA